MAELAAVILAGGLGTRLGAGPKSEIRIGGKRLIERVMEAIGKDAAPVLAAIGHHEAASLGLPDGIIPVADLQPGVLGPISGLAAAVGWLATREPPTFLLSVAVDTPFFPNTFAARALALMKATTKVVVAAHSEQIYPTNALWRFEAVRALPRDIASGAAPRSLKRLIDSLEHRILDWVEEAGGDPFANLNTPDDLVALERRAAIP